MKNPEKQFMKRSRRYPVVHIKVWDGRFNVVGLGVWHSYWRDPYHLLLTVPWIGFMGIISFFYLITNTLFALLYMLQPDGVTNMRPGSFSDAFFFSVQTLATIGYGVMAPKSFYANTIVCDFDQYLVMKLKSFNERISITLTIFKRIINKVNEN